MCRHRAPRELPSASAERLHLPLEQQVSEVHLPKGHRGSDHRLWRRLHAVAYRHPLDRLVAGQLRPQSIADPICWSATGARTTESQTHCQMASGPAMPRDFRNSAPQSNLLAGNRAWPQTSAELVFGRSITAAGGGWETTARLVLEVAERL